MMALKKRPGQASRRKAAVALRYQTGKDRAPVVLAKGRGVVAEKILEEARKLGLPLHEDGELVELLSGVDLLQEIPQELYAAVAEILIFVKKAAKP